MAWLYHILRDGTLKDNRTYQVTDGVLSSLRSSERLELEWRGPGQWKNAGNNESQIWSFMTQVAEELSETLSNRPKDAVILFGDREYENNTSDDFIQLIGTDARNFRLTAGNLIGTIKKGDYSLKISSRFGDSFLRFIIADADGFLELENLGGESAGGENDWLLVYLWMIRLKRAYRLGLPKAYVSHTETTSRVRGKIEPLQYILGRETGRYRCTFREHSYCNEATILISETFRSLKSHEFVRDSHSLANAFHVASEGHRRRRNELLETPHFTNPFYSDYNGLIDLSKRLIRNRSSDLEGTSDTSAFLFDVSMLFEYFIRKLLQRNGAHLESKSARRWKIPAAGSRKASHRLEPDLVFSVDGKTCVFDVKYKAFNSHDGVSREDLFQLHTYVGQCSNEFEVSGCGFIYPISQSRWDSMDLGSRSGVISDSFQQGGRSVPFHVLFLRVPDEGPEFGMSFVESCKVFVKGLKSALGVRSEATRRPASAAITPRPATVSVR